MSLENAIKILREQQFSNPEWAVDIIQRADSLDVLKRIMIDEKTNLGADQFVSLRMKNIFRGDPAYAEKTIAQGKKVLCGYDVSPRVIDYYFEELPEALMEITMPIELGTDGFPKKELTNQELEKVHAFFNAAKQYLFEQLRAYVVEPDS